MTPNTQSLELIYKIPENSFNEDQLVEQLGKYDCTDAIIGTGRPGTLAVQFSHANYSPDYIRSSMKAIQEALPFANLLSIKAPQREPFFLIFDIECTFSNLPNVPEDFKELLELGAIVIDNQYNVISEFQSIVKPQFHPALTPECLVLLNITQDEADSASELPIVWKEFESWLNAFSIACSNSWGVSDKTFLSNQLERYQITSSFFHIGYRDLKKQFRLSRPKKIPPAGLKKACDILSIKMQGRHHSALDDAHNALSVAKQVNLLDLNDD